MARRNPRILTRYFRRLGAQDESDPDGPDQEEVSDAEATEDDASPGAADEAGAKPIDED